MVHVACILQMFRLVLCVSDFGSLTSPQRRHGDEGLRAAGPVWRGDGSPGALPDPHGGRLQATCFGHLPEGRSLAEGGWVYYVAPGGVFSMPVR